MEQQKIIERLQRIFEIFLHENFATTSNVYFEKLITHLAEKGKYYNLHHYLYNKAYNKTLCNNDLYCLPSSIENLYVLQAPFAMDWVDKCITLLDEDFTKVNPKVTSFMLNLCSLLMQNEWILITLKERKIMDR